MAQEAGTQHLMDAGSNTFHLPGSSIWVMLMRIVRIADAATGQVVCGAPRHKAELNIIGHYGNAVSSSSVITLGKRIRVVPVPGCERGQPYGSLTDYQPERSITGCKR